MNAAIEIASGLLMVTGALFAAAAALGLIRFPDVFARMHAASKAGTLGSGLMLIALALHARELDVITRAIAGVVFFLLTAPISAHLVAKAALAAGYRPCAVTKMDVLAPLLDQKKKQQKT